MADNQETNKKIVSIVCYNDSTAKLTTNDLHIEGEHLASELVIDFSNTVYKNHEKRVEIFSSDGYHRYRFDEDIKYNEVVTLDIEKYMLTKGELIVYPYVYDNETHKKVKYIPNESLIVTKAMTFETSPVAERTKDVLDEFEDIITHFIDRFESWDSQNLETITDALIDGDYLPKLTKDESDIVNDNNVVIGSIEVNEHEIVVGRKTLENIAFTAMWDDLLNVPAFKTVATTGSYTDLINKPNFATVALSGRYQDLLNLPNLKTVATTGNYNDLDNLPNLKPVATTGNYGDLTNKPDLKPVATSGRYDSLTHRPALKPVAESGDYRDLINKPVVPVIPNLEIDDATLTSNQYIAQVKVDPDNKHKLLVTKRVLPQGFSGNYNDLTNKPTKLSNFANDTRFITLDDIPEVDLTDYVKDTDLHEVATTGDYEDLINKPTIFPGDWDSLINKPTKLSDFTNDTGFITLEDIPEDLLEVDLSDYVKRIELHAVATTGDYEDLINQPTIPKDLGELTNTPGYLKYTDLDESILEGSLTDYVTHTQLQTELEGYIPGQWIENTDINATETLENGYDILFTGKLESLTLTIPANIGHGYFSGFNFKTEDTEILITFNNLSNYNIKIYKYDYAMEEIQQVPDKIYNVAIYCDGFNINVYYTIGE